MGVYRRVVVIVGLMFMAGYLLVTARAELSPFPRPDFRGCSEVPDSATCLTPSPAAAPTAAPPPTRREQAAFPTAATTGPVGRLRPSGPITADQPGQVVENVDVDCEINVVAPGVTIRNTRVHCAHDAEWLIVLRNDAGTTTIDGVAIERVGSTALVKKGVYQVGEGPVDMKFSRITGTQDACLCASGEISDSFIQVGAKIGDFHNDGIQSGGGSGFVIRHNTVFNPNSDTSAIALFEEFSPQRDILVDRNLLAGGGYTIYAGAGTRSPANVRITNNVWSRRFFPAGGRFGAVTAWCGRCPGAVWARNRWESGEPLVP